MENPNEFSELSLLAETENATDHEASDFESMLKLVQHPEEFLQLDSLQRLASFLEDHPKLSESQRVELKDALIAHRNFSGTVPGLDFNTIEETRRRIGIIGKHLNDPREVDWMLGAEAGYSVLKPLIIDAFKENDFSALATIGKQWRIGESKENGVKKEALVNIFGNALSRYVYGKEPQEILDILSTKEFADLMIADDPVHAVFIGFTKDNARRDVQRAEQQRRENGLAA